MMYPLYLGDERVRYALGRIGARNLFIFGVNPSTANATQSDPTIQQVERFLAAWGEKGWFEEGARESFDGFVMLNLYPLRETDPAELPMKPNTTICKMNVETICRLLQGEPAPTVWAAWGDSIEERTYLKSCLGQIVDQMKRQKIAVNWKKVSPVLTGRGNPKHPNPRNPQLTKQDVLTGFDMAGYLG